MIGYIVLGCSSLVLAYLCVKLLKVNKVLKSNNEYLYDITSTVPIELLESMQDTDYSGFDFLANSNKGGKAYRILATAHQMPIVCGRNVLVSGNGSENVFPNLKWDGIGGVPVAPSRRHTPFADYLRFKLLIKG